ncbi:MAG: hypothetical protein WA326_12955 [Nitrososphaeraceae archaeon]
MKYGVDSTPSPLDGIFPYRVPKPFPIKSERNLHVIPFKQPPINQEINLLLVINSEKFEAELEVGLVRILLVKKMTPLSIWFGQESFPQMHQARNSFPIIKRD